MSYLALGIAILASLLLAVKLFVNLKPRISGKLIKWFLFGIIGLACLYFFITGRGAWAFALLPAAIPYLFRLLSLARAAKAFSRMKYGGPRKSSEVKTKMLRMHLDHLSGEITGEVISGQFSGAQVEEMDQDSLLSLLNECQILDKEGARIIQDFLDRKYHGWKNEEEKSRRSASSPQKSNMDRKKALEILGLAEGSNQDQIREAYHRLITNLHPDRGGSTYLASQINQAKDVLLED